MRSLSMISVDDLDTDDLQQVDSKLASWGDKLMRAGHLGGRAPDGQIDDAGGGARGSSSAARSALFYKAVGANGLTARADVELASPTVLYYPQGTVFEVFEKRRNQEGKSRLRTPDGWVSERSGEADIVIAELVTPGGQPPIHVTPNGKLGRSCEGAGTGTLALASAQLTAASAAASAAASERLAEAMPRWFGDGGANCIRGSLSLRAVVEGKPAAVREAVRRALLETIGAFAVGDHVSVSVYGGRLCCTLPTEAGEEPSTDFSFEVSVPDANDRAPVLQVLELEAQCGGARRLLPSLAGALSLAGGRLSVRLDIMGTQRPL